MDTYILWYFSCWKDTTVETVGIPSFLTHLKKKNQSSFYNFIKKKMELAPLLRQQILHSKHICVIFFKAMFQKQWVGGSKPHQCFCAQLCKLVRTFWQWQCKRHKSLHKQRKATELNLVEQNLSTIRNTSVPVFSGTAHAHALSLGVGNAKRLMALSGNPEPLAPETQTRVQAQRSSCPSPTGTPCDNLAKELMMHAVLSDPQ